MILGITVTIISLFHNLSSFNSPKHKHDPPIQLIEDSDSSPNSTSTPAPWLPEGAFPSLSVVPSTSPWRAPPPTCVLRHHYVAFTLFSLLKPTAKPNN